MDLMEDDVTADYPEPGYGLQTIESRSFSVEELKIDMSRLKSIWGLMLRI